MRVVIANTELKKEDLHEHTGLVPGKYVMLSVADTGTGMSPEVQSRLFEPFFSTKEFGKGTGPGLAAVYGIVQKSAGGISVLSSPGAGTTFKIFLPRVIEKEAMPAPTLPLPLAESLRGTETVLLVEDQASLRSLSREILEKLVLTAAHAEEAMRVACAFPDFRDIEGQRGKPLRLRDLSAYFSDHLIAAPIEARPSPPR